MSFIQRLSCGGIVVDDICLSVVIKQQARIDSTHLRQADRITPLAGFGVVGSEEDGSLSVHIGCYQIEKLIVRIVLDVGRIDAIADAYAVLQ